MKIIKSNIIPFKPYLAITLYPFVFTRAKLNATQLRHEEIHAEQQKELMLVVFYILYFAEWIINLVRYKGANMAYRRISFEREAYAHQTDENYLCKRNMFAMWRK